jgi:hypothetical protein
LKSFNVRPILDFFLLNEQGKNNEKAKVNDNDEGNNE